MNQTHISVSKCFVSNQNFGNMILAHFSLKSTRFFIISNHFIFHPSLITQVDLDIHLEEHRDERTGEQRVHKCKTCGAEFNMIYLLKEHQKTQHKP